MDLMERMTGGTLASQLPRLVQETELQKMLADEKMRSEQHKTNYQTLKVEHSRLQDEYVVLQKELKATIEESHLVQEKYKKLLEQARMDLSNKAAESESIKNQALDPKKLEMLKLQMEGETERPFREKFYQLEKELEKYRAECNSLKYEFSFVKSEYEHDRQEHQQIIEEMRLRHEAEVTNLRKERENAIARQQADSSSDSQHLRMVQRENIQLNMKVKGLLSELEEIRAQREHSGMQADSVTRLQVKQMAEYQASIKALETEKQSLKAQYESLQRECSLTSDHQNHLVSRNHDIEKENLTLKNRMEEVSHKSKLEVTNIKMEMLRERGELERERDRLRNQIEDVKAELEVLRHSQSQQEMALVEKEREMVRRIQCTKEEEWQKLHKIEMEKMEVETKLRELEKRKIDDDAERHQITEKADARVRRAEELKESAEKEALSFSNKLQNQQTILDQLEHERLENSSLKGRLQRLEAQYSAYVDGERDLMEMNDKLEREANNLRAELHQAKVNGLKDKDQTESHLAESRTVWMEERCHLQGRIDELDVQLSGVQKRLSNTVNGYKQKKNQLKSLVYKLKDKVNSLKLKVDQLQIEKEALKRTIPTEAHEQLKKRLRDILQRNGEFRALLSAANIKQTNIGDLQFGTISTEFLPTATAFFDTNHEDLFLLKKRLDALDHIQRDRLDEMKGRTTLFMDTCPDCPTFSSEKHENNKERTSDENPDIQLDS